MEYFSLLAFFLQGKSENKFLNTYKSKDYRRSIFPLKKIKSKINKSLVITPS